MVRNPILRAAVILAILSSCGSVDEEQLLSVLAPRAWLGATVNLDGQEVAELSEMMSNTGLMGSVLRRMRPGSELEDLVAINLPLASWQIETGQHEIVVEVVGGARQSFKFRYPFQDGATHCMVFVNESEALVGDACDVTRLAS